MSERADSETSSSPNAEAQHYPKVSVVIPTPPEMQSPRALEALRDLDYPSERIEVIIAKGRRPALQRNAAAREAEGEVLFFLDDDSIAEGDLFKANLAYYADDGVACVGGPALPLADEGTIQIATDVVFASLLGDFRGCTRFARRGPARAVSEDEVILCNLSIRKSVFDEAGGFHNALYPNEENALLQKVADSPKGWKIMYAPDAPIRRPRPATVREFWKKVFGYGEGRLEQTLVQPSPICFLRLSAVLFPLYWLVLPLLAFKTGLAFVPAALYVAADIAMSAKIAATVRSLRVPVAALLLFPVMHTAYPCGILWAATGRRLFGRAERTDDVELTRVKAFGEGWR